MAMLLLVSISIITTVFAQREEAVPSFYTDDELTYADPSDKFIQQRSMSDRNFLRLGRGDTQLLPDNNDNEYDELVEDTRRPTRTSNGNFLRFGRAGSSFLRFGRGGSSNFLRFGRNGSNNFLRFGRNKDDSMRDRGYQKERKMSDDEVKMIMRQIRMGRSVKVEEAGARKKRAVASKPSRSSDSFLRLGRNDGQKLDQDDVFEEAPTERFGGYLERLKQSSDVPIVQLLAELICKMDRDNSKCTRLG